MVIEKRKGLVIARHRREILIEDDDGETRTALISGRRLRPLTGDEIYYSLEDDGTAVVREILPRSSLLERIDNRGRAEGVAANLSLICVVVAPRPAPDWQLVDRYLVAAALLGIDAILIRNKSDIPSDSLDRQLRLYRAIGYAVYRTCTKAQQGLAELADGLSGHRSVLVGQSGVGKSSLLNALTATETQAVMGLSERRSLGRHTTTAATLFRLPRGGELIDSPGVRRYSPSIRDPQSLAAGFIEFQPHIGKCRFNDCRHGDEPDCAVRRAVESGEIAETRYCSYLALRDLIERLDEN